MKRAVLLTVLLCACSGYVVNYRDNDQADRRWVETPPENIEKEEAELPPPKEVSVVLVAPGAFAGLGYERTFSPEHRAFNADIGLETTVAFGKGRYEYPFDYDFSHRFIPSLDFLVGLKAAWVIVDRVSLAPGPMFCEVVGGVLPWPQIPFAVGLGWNGRLDENKHGVVGSLYLGPVYVRFQHLLHDSLTVMFGVSVTVPLGFLMEQGAG